MCLMFSPRGCVSVMVYRALHAPRVSVPYQVLPVLNRPHHMCSGMVYALGGNFVNSKCNSCGDAVYVPAGGKPVVRGYGK